jgi:hypothetical protein
MKHLLVLLLAAASVSCAGLHSSTARPAQRVLPDPLVEGYVSAHATGDSRLLINEFTRPGDSIGNWERLVTRTYLKAPGQAEMLARTTAEGLKRDCPHANVDLQRIGASEFSVEHSHNGCGPWEGHRSIRKVINGRDGVYMISFDMKNRAYVAAEYAAWKRMILGARLEG